MPVEFNLKDSALLIAAVSAAFPALAQTDQAGRVDFATKGVSATGADGRTRALGKGAQIYSGDTIQTADNGRAQLKFTDGGQISLQPRSEFRIENYRYSGKPDGGESAIFNLLRGGLRTITGLVGTRERKSYAMRTQVATIGIRGTQYSLAYGDSITITATEGAVEACNPVGCVTAIQGQTIYVKDQNSAPVIIARKVDLPPEPAPDLPLNFASNESRLGNGSLSLVPNPVVAPPPQVYLATGANDPVNLAIAHDRAFFGGECCALSNSVSAAFIPTSATLNGMTQMTQFNDLGTPVGPVTWAGPIVNSGNDAALNGGQSIIAWGRWNGAITGGTGARSNHDFGGSETSTRSLHYVVGVPTPAADISALRSAGVANATYSLIGATSPTNCCDSGVVNAASLGVNFVTGQVNTTLNLTISGVTFNVNATNIPIAAGSSGFSTSLGGAVTVGATGGTCTAGCNATIDGLFAGNMGVRAGYGYKIADGLVPNPATSPHAVGVVAFKKN